jgi:hypothetical protein
MQSDQEKANPPVMERETFAVNPARLAWSVTGREICEGDIHASYSADNIGMGHPIRKPFKWNGSLWVCTSVAGSALTASGVQEHEAYRLVPARMFKSTPTTYETKTSKVETAEAARSDPNGFYHGVTVKHGKENLVLCGPPIRFTPEPSPVRPDGAPEAAPEQLELF